MNAPRTLLQRALLHQLSRLALSRRDLARRSGINPFVIARILAGRQAGADADTIAKLADALGIDAAELPAGEINDIPQFLRRQKQWHD